MKNLLLIVIMVTSISCVSQKNSFSNVHEKEGKVGIGTSTPDELLTVKGKIHTQEVLVDLNGAVAPDYVFEDYIDGTSALNPSYARLSLTALAEYIEKNRHLPGIPSASSMELEGIALKEFNLLLLEKLEELTVYTLEQQEEIEKLKMRVEKLTKDSN